VRGSGVPQTEAAYHLSSGIIRGRIPFGKFITGVLCIGSGHSMGREGPSVQIGAGLASLVGQWLHLSPRRVRDLVPSGPQAPSPPPSTHPSPPSCLPWRKSSAT
jgi:CIC family chloride channel protein